MAARRPISAAGEGPAHVEWNEDVRGETLQQQFDRNWEQLLQELRVTQTGVQIFAGILLSLPFQKQFEDLSSPLRWIYFATVLCAVGATVLITSPVAMHRLLFRQRRLGQIVDAAHHFASGGLVLLAFALVGAIILAVGAAQGIILGVICGVTVAGLLLVCWLAYPLLQR